MPIIASFVSYAMNRKDRCHCCYCKELLLVQETLEEIFKDSSGEALSKTSGLLSLMEKFSTLFGLKLAYFIVVATAHLATTLHAKAVSAQVCVDAVKATKAFLEMMLCL